MGNRGNEWEGEKSEGGREGENERDRERELGGCYDGSEYCPMQTSGQSLQGSKVQCAIPVPLRGRTLGRHAG